MSNFMYMDKLNILQLESDKWAGKDYDVHLFLNSVLRTVEEIMQFHQMESTLFKVIISATVRQFIIKKLERETGGNAVKEKIGELYKFIDLL